LTQIKNRRTGRRPSHLVGRVLGPTCRAPRRPPGGRVVGTRLRSRVALRRCFPTVAARVDLAAGLTPAA